MRGKKLYDLNDGGDHLTLTAEEVADHVNATPNEELRALVEEMRNEANEKQERGYNMLPVKLRGYANELEELIDDER